MDTRALIPLRFLTASIERPPCGVDGCSSAHEVTVYRDAAGAVVDHPQIGDVFFEPWALRAHADKGTHSCPWDNCDGLHLWVMVPDARGSHWWNVDGRASNCTLPADRAHRCWVRHGDPSKPETLHVDKAGGRTCSAGAGSIGTKGWHGFLDRGAIRQQRSGR